MDAEIPSTIGDPSMGEATEKPSDVYDDRLARSVAAEAVESEQSMEHYKSAVEMDLVKEREERELLRKSNVYEDCLASSVESEKSMEHYKSAVEMDLVKEREERELLRKSNVYEDCLASSVESEKSMEHYKSAVEMDLVKEREERELLRKRWLEDEEKRRVEQAITHRESGRTNAEKEQMNMGGGGQQQKMTASQPANYRKRSCNPGPPDMFPGGPADWRQDIQMMGGLANGNMPPQGYGSQAAMQNGGYPPDVAQNEMQRVPQQQPMQCVPMPSISQSHAPFHGHMMYNNGAGGPVPGVPVGPTNPMTGGPGPGGMGHMNPMGPGPYQQQVPDPSPGYTSCSHMGNTGFPQMGNDAETSVRTPPTGTTPLQQSQQNTPSRATPAQQAPTSTSLGLIIDRKVVDGLESSLIVDLDDKARNFLPSVPPLPGRESLTTPTSTGVTSTRLQLENFTTPTSTPHGTHSVGNQGVTLDIRNSTQDNRMTVLITSLPLELQYEVISKIPLQDRPRINHFLPYTQTLFQRNTIKESVEMGTVAQNGKIFLKVIFNESNIVLQYPVEDSTLNDDIHCECPTCCLLIDHFYPVKALPNLSSLIQYFGFVSVKSLALKATPAEGLVGMLVAQSTHRKMKLSCDSLVINMHPLDTTTWDMPVWTRFFEMTQPKSLTFVSEEEDPEMIVIPQEIFDLYRIKRANLSFDNVKCRLNDQQFMLLKGSQINFGESFVLTADGYKSFVEQKVRQWLQNPLAFMEIRVGVLRGSLSEQIITRLCSLVNTPSLEVEKNFWFTNSFDNNSAGEAISVFKPCTGTGFVLTSEWLCTFKSDYENWKNKLRKHRKNRRLESPALYPSALSHSLPPPPPPPSTDELEDGEVA